MFPFSFKHKIFTLVDPLLLCRPQKSIYILSWFYYLASQLPPTPFSVWLASSVNHLKDQTTPKLRNHQLRCILELKCFTGLQLDSAQDIHGQIAIAHKTYKNFHCYSNERHSEIQGIYFCPAVSHRQHCDYIKCSPPTVSSILFVSSCSLQRKFSFTVPLGEHTGSTFR